MKSPDTLLCEKIRRTRGVLAEVIEQAELQGWRLRIKEDGFLFFPPAGSVRQGFESVFARDPGSASHTQKQIKDRFRKAGMKFPEDEKPERSLKVSQIPVKPQPPVDSFSLIRQRINQAADALADVDGLLKKIEADTAKLKLLGDTLKSLGGF